MYSNSGRTGKWLIFPVLFLLTCALFTAPLASETAESEAGGIAANNAAEMVTFDNNNEMGGVSGTGLYSTMKQGGPLMILLVILAFISLTIIIERLTYYTRNRVWDIKSMEEMLRKVPQYSSARYKADHTFSYSAIQR